MRETYEQNGYLIQHPISIHMRLVFLFFAVLGVKSVYEVFHHKLTQSTNTLQIWTTTPSKKVFQDSAVPTNSEDTIKVYSAQNEHEPFIISINPTSAQQVSIELPDFGNPLINVKMFLVKYVDVQLTSDDFARSGLNPDPLVHIDDGYTLDLSPNINNVLWIDIMTRKGVTGAQDYNGNIKIGGISIPIKLHVFKFEIPAMQHIKTHFNSYTPIVFDKYSKDAWDFDNKTRYYKYLDMYQNFLLDHRIQLVKGTTPCQLRGIHGGDNRYDCDTKKFTFKEENLDPLYDCEARIPNMMGKGVEINGVNTPVPFMMPVGNICAYSDLREDTMCGVTKTPSEYLSLDFTTPYNKIFGEYLKALEEYLDKFGMLDRFSFYIMDEPQNQKAYDCVAWGTHYIKTFAPKLLTFVTEPPKSQIFHHKNFSRSKIDIWCPVLYQFYPKQTFNRKHHCGEEIWTYYLWDYTPSISSIKLDDMGMSHLLVGFFFWRYRITGILYYGFCRWQEYNPWVDTNPPELNGRLAGEHGMIYPPSMTNEAIDYGSNGHKLITSIRLELLRDTLELYEYLYVMNGNKHPTTTNQHSFVDQLVKVLVPSKFGMVRNDEIAYNLRRVMGLYIGKEISKIDLNNELPPPHPRAEGPPGNYYINFQNATHPSVDPLIIDGKQYFKVWREKYNEEKGYGFYYGYANWFSAYYYREEKYPELNELKRSTLRCRKHVFNFAIPNGGYDISLTIGWAYWSTPNQTIHINGVEFFNGDKSYGIGEFATVKKSIYITGKYLILQVNETGYTYLTHMEIESNGKTSMRNDDAVDVGSGRDLRCTRGRRNLEDFLRYGLVPLLLIFCCIPIVIVIVLIVLAVVFLPKKYFGKGESDVMLKNEFE